VRAGKGRKKEEKIGKWNRNRRKQQKMKRKNLRIVMQTGIRR
jgi:hypothetical protein